MKKKETIETLSKRIIIILTIIHCLIVFGSIFVLHKIGIPNNFLIIIFIILNDLYFTYLFAYDFNYVAMINGLADYLKDRLSLEYFLQKDFEYKIVKNDLIKVNIYKVLINNKVFDLTSNYSIDELKEKLNNCTELTIYCHKLLPCCSCCCSVEFDTKVIKFTISKETFEEILKFKMKNKTHTNELNWNVNLHFSSIHLRNTFIPNTHLIFYNQNNDPQLLERIKHISKKELLIKLLERDQPSNIYNNLTDRDFVIIDTLDKDELTAKNAEKNWIKFDEMTELTVNKPNYNVKTVERQTFAKIENSNDTFNQRKFENKNIQNQIDKIEDKLKKGFKFECISFERWQNYKQEILKLLDSDFELTIEQENEIIQILKKLEENMLDQKKINDKLQKDTTIQALKSMLKLDGIDY